MTKVLVLAEIEKDSLTPATLATLQAAHEIAPTCTLLVASSQSSLAEKGANLSGVEKVLQYPVSLHVAEDYAALLLKEAPNFTHILLPATTFGKNIGPKVAALLNSMQISDITGIVDEATFIRPIYAGNALAKVKSLDKVKVITVRSSAFSPVNTQDKPAEIVVKEDSIKKDERVRFMKAYPSESKRPDLSSAKIVVAGGRGLKSAENFKMIEALADELGAAVGASRAAVDAGFISNDYQVGQTGKVVAPTLYIAIGISGAIQHLAGILESKVIVAINQDADAPIFEIANYGLVGDLFTILPQLQATLKK